MYRVGLLVLLALLLPGCSIGSKPLSMGFSENSPTADGSPGSPGRTAVAALADAGSPDFAPASTRAQALAKPDDKAPEGSFEKAPAGALADRDYSATKLDPEKARDLINAYRRQHRLKPLKLNIELINAA